MGKKVAEKVGSRLGKTLLELGGNNAIIVTPDADLKMMLMGTVFGAVGTCGQRCTSTRRLIVHENVYDQVKNSLKEAYEQIKITTQRKTINNTRKKLTTRRKKTNNTRKNEQCNEEKTNNASELFVRYKIGGQNLL